MNLTPADVQWLRNHLLTLARQEGILSKRARRRGDPVAATMHMDTSRIAWRIAQALGDPS